MATVTAPVAIARGRPRAARRGGLGLGVITLYLSVIVLIPLAAVAVKALSQSPASLWASISNASVVQALVVTVGASLAVAVIGAVMGTVVAWVLVRDEFPGRGHRLRPPAGSGAG